MRRVFERWSGGFTRKPSCIFCVRSAGMRPSRISLSLNRSRTHKPSERGREVKVLRVSDQKLILELDQETPRLMQALPMSKILRKISIY
jgi:hypothetical protein